MSSDWPAADALLAGRYRLVSLLETGGMAEIWRARDELLDRPVAVKLPTGPQVVWREARMAAKLSHPGIAAVHDYREALRPDGSVVPFVVMELLAGESVAARVDRELIGWDEAARVGAAVADALADAHAGGVVHRDIKPGNVMLTPNGVKILDFGISVSAGEQDDDDTGATFGTPAYVAPERLDGMPAEPATDVYGLGVLLFEMVTGDPPYPVETWDELAEARAAGPSVLPPALPADFRNVVERCLDPDPARRPTAARLRAELLAVALRPAEPAAGRQAPGTPHEAGADETAGASEAHEVLSVARDVPATVAPRPRNAALRPTYAQTAPPFDDEAASARRGPGEGNSAARAAFAYDGYREEAGRLDDIGFATGRASAATIDMAPPPRRRLAVTIVAAAVIAGAAGAFSAIAWVHRDSGGNVAVPAPATASAFPLDTLSAPATQPSSASPTSSAAPSATLTYADAVSRMRSAVQAGVANRQIRKDVGLDLLNLLQNLSNTPAAGDVNRQLDAIGRKIRTRLGEGALTQARAVVLQDRLADLDRAAGT